MVDAVFACLIHFGGTFADANAFKDSFASVVCHVGLVGCRFHVVLVLSVHLFDVYVGLIVCCSKPYDALHFKAQADCIIGRASDAQVLHMQLIHFHITLHDVLVMHIYSNLRIHMLLDQPLQIAKKT